MTRRSAAQDVICVHCGKAFRAEILAANTGQAGVKCPHCRLFMPLGRVASDDAPASS